MFEEKIATLNASLTGNTETYPESKRIYTISEIMNILAISKSTAYKLVNSGAFHCVRIGGQYRISKKSFDSWLEKKREVSV